MATRRARLQIRPNVGPKARPIGNGKPLESDSKDVKESHEIVKQQTSDVNPSTDANILKEKVDIVKQPSDVNPSTDANILKEKVDIVKQPSDVKPSTDANILKEKVDIVKQPSDVKPSTDANIFKENVDIVKQTNDVKPSTDANILKEKVDIVKQPSDVKPSTDANILKENVDRDIMKQTSDMNLLTNASILKESVDRDIIKQTSDVNSSTHANILKENVAKDINKISRDSLVESCEKNNNSLQQVFYENSMITVNESKDDVSYSLQQTFFKDESQPNITVSSSNITVHSLVNINKENTSEKRSPPVESDNINSTYVQKHSLLKETKKSRVLPLRSRFPKAKPNILSISRLRGTKPLPVPEPEEKCMLGINTLCSTPVVPDHPASDKGTSGHVPKLSCKSLEKEETPSCRRRRYIKGNKPPERSKMTMRDLIYWNPINNPMISSTDDPDVPNEEEIIETSDIVEEDPVEEPETVLETEGDKSTPVPQVKVAADGSIVINEESLVVEAAPKKKNMNNSPVIYEKSSCTTYTSFRKRTNTKIWTEKETARFYKALSTVGTDFSLMNSMFLKRTRTELKNKFKKEERVNKTLVDKAIRERQHFDESIFEPSSESENEIAKQKKNIMKAKKVVLKRSGKQKEIKENNSPKVNLEIPIVKQDFKKKHVRKQKKKYLPSEEIQLDSGIEEIPQSPVISNNIDLVQIEKGIEEKEDLDSEEIMFTSIHRPTRSGRQPKRSHVFTIDIPVTRPRKIRPPERRRTETIPQVVAENKAEQQSSSTSLSGGQLLLITGESNVSNSQVIHVYMISPPSTGQLTSLDLTSLLNQAVLIPSSETTTESQPATLLEQLMFESDTLGDGLTTVVVSEVETIMEGEVCE